MLVTRRTSALHCLGDLGGGRWEDYAGNTPGSCRRCRTGAMRPKPGHLQSVRSEAVSGRAGVGWGQLGSLSLARQGQECELQVLGVRGWHAPRQHVADVPR